MPTNKPEVVLPELPNPYSTATGFALYNADQLLAYGQACIDTLTRPADGEFVMVPRENPDRDAANPGGCECEKCGRVFIGAEWHSLCGVCVDTLPRLAVPQQSGQEVVAGVKLLNDVERNSLNDLLSNLEHEAGDVEDLPPSIEDDDAYWPYHQWHAITKLLGREYAPVSATQPQQPAEAVAVDLERFRPMVEKYRVDWSAYVQTMQKAGRSAIDGKKKVDEACELLAIIDNAPPAIDIGKLRELYDAAGNGFHISETCGQDGKYWYVSKFPDMASLHSFVDAWTAVMLDMRDAK